MNENYDIWLDISMRAVGNKFHSWMSFIDITSFHTRWLQRKENCFVHFILYDVYRFWQFEKKNEEHSKFGVLRFFLFYSILCANFWFQHNRKKCHVKKRARMKECKNIRIFIATEHSRLHLILCIQDCICFYEKLWSAHLLWNERESVLSRFVSINNFVQLLPKSSLLQIIFAAWDKKKELKKTTSERDPIFFFEFGFWIYFFRIKQHKSWRKIIIFFVFLIFCFAFACCHFAAKGANIFAFRLPCFRL